MGEVADMMLDGTLCEGCGEWFGDGQAPGYPRYHKRCRPVTPPPVAKPKCPECGRKVKPTGLADHMRDSHGPAKPKPPEMDYLDEQDDRDLEAWLGGRT